MKEVSKERLDNLIADLQKMVDEDNLGSVGIQVDKGETK